MRILFLIFFLLCGSASIAQYTVKSLPNQKLINNSYVSNPDSILSTSTVIQIDTLLGGLESRTTVQVAVVVVESIGNADIVDFSQELFRSWGIGQDQRDNGLLILFVNDKRTVRFHTGYGLEGVLPDITCKRIQEEFMVPAFRKGGYDEGMLAGLAQVEKVLTDPAYAQELKEPSKKGPDSMITLIIFLSVIPVPVLVFLFGMKWYAGGFTNSKKPKATAYPEMRMSSNKWALMYFVIPALIVVGFSLSRLEHKAVLCALALYLYYLSTCLERLWRTQRVIRNNLEAKNFQQVVEFLRSQQWHWLFLGILFPLPILVYFFYHLSRKKIYRNYPRDCKQCGSAMQKLDETQDDGYLTEGQRKEEELRSVDYDVWKCGACGAIDMWFYLNRNTKYQPCPKCQTNAFHSLSKLTITSASYTSAGEGEEKKACEFCHHEDTSRYTIAQLTHSSSSSGSGSSSSGGSWGGGSSGGGGSSSSW